LALLVVIFIAGHGTILYYVSSHVAVSAAVASGVIVVVVIKHLGLFGRLYRLFRQSRRNAKTDSDTED